MSLLFTILFYAVIIVACYGLVTKVADKVERALREELKVDVLPQTTSSIAFWAALGIILTAITAIKFVLSIIFLI